MSQTLLLQTYEYWYVHVIRKKRKEIPISNVCTLSLKLTINMLFKLKRSHLSQQTKVVHLMIVIYKFQFNQQKGVCFTHLDIKL